MFGDGISFDKRANFLLKNVCDLPNNLNTVCDIEVISGLSDFRKLLLTIYNDIITFKVNDPLESYHNLTSTANLFLYAISIVGELKKENSEYYFSVLKDRLKKEYKKSTTFPLKALENYGISFTYYKDDKIVKSYRSCKHFCIHFNDSPTIALALNFLSSTYKNINHKTEYGDVITMFAKADYERLVLKLSGSRDKISPLRSDIVNTIPLKKNIYTSFVSQLLNMGLATSCYYQRYCCPFWNINLLKGKKLICKTQVFGDYIHIAVPVPISCAESLIVNRKKYPHSITSAVERFNCVSCGKCKKTGKSYMSIIDGVKCCSGHSEAITIYMTLKNMEEVDAITHLIKEFIDC